MKKLLKICSFIAAVATITVSCQKNEVSSLADQNLEESGTFISLKDAITVSQSYFEEAEQMNKNNGRVGADSTLAGNKNKKVKKTKSYKDEKTNEDLFYVLNYEGSGFSVISADKRMNPVLAFSETSEFGDDAENLDGVRESDGYRSLTYYYIWVDNRTEIARCLSNTVEYIGMNWGWYGNCNGYFYTDYSFDTTEPYLGSPDYGTYSAALHALTGIRK